jgi:hemerythrin-like domain-containing protein
MIDPFNAAPGFDDPIGVLRACHRRMERQLGTLSRLCRHLPENHADADARTAAAAIMRYFDTAAVNHHADEEATLLPRLLAARPQLAALCAEIESDHVTLGERWQRLRPRLAAVAVGRSGHLPLREVEAFCAGYAAHIAKEEADLLPRAQEALDKEVLAEIGEEMAARRNL